MTVRLAVPASAGGRRPRRGAGGPGRADDARPAASSQEAIGYLREHGIILTWDQAMGTVRAATPEAITTITVKAS